MAPSAYPETFAASRVSTADHGFHGSMMHFTKTIGPLRLCHLTTVYIRDGLRLYTPSTDDHPAKVRFTFVSSRLLSAGNRLTRRWILGKLFSEGDISLLIKGEKRRFETFTSIFIFIFIINSFEITIMNYYHYYYCCFFTLGIYFD